MFISCHARYKRTASTILEHFELTFSLICIDALKVNFCNFFYKTIVHNSAYYTLMAYPKVKEFLGLKLYVYNYRFKKVADPNFLNIVQRGSYL